MDVSKEVGFAILGGSTNQAQATKVVAFAVLGAAGTQAEVSKVVSFAVIDDTVPPPLPSTGGAAAILLFM